MWCSRPRSSSQPSRLFICQSQELEKNIEPLFQELPDQYHQSIHRPFSHPPIHTCSLPSSLPIVPFLTSLSLPHFSPSPLSLSLLLSLSAAAAVSISSWQKGTLWINDTELLKVQILNNEFHHQKHNNFSNHKIALPFHIDCACATRCTESTVCIRAR